ncbi:MAG: hypothetical protein HZB67_00255 [Candidatus Aenigmarchaeota archaeon]|nr:hypothetical protein [Candidatus Aenigmarchaeota archaeon]
MGELIKENCGFCVANNLHDAHKLLRGVQHRGQEAAGLGVKHSGGIDSIKWTGYVTDFSLEDILKLLHGEYYEGHVRYSTSGSKDTLLRDAHPHVIGGTVSSYPEHILTRNSIAACVHNGTICYDNLACSTDSLKTDCDTEAFLHLYKKIGIEQLMKEIPGAYSSAILDADLKGPLVFRDRFGVRPCWIGEKDGKYIAASEDFAITEIGGRPIRELGPGEIAYLSGGTFRTESIVEPIPRFCFFELNYLMDHDSTHDGTKAWDIRYALGKQLAEEFRPGDADMVTYIPHCPKPYTMGYGEEARIQFQDIFYKKKEHERSFMRSKQEQRQDSISSNLYLRDNLDIKGRVIIVIDDSIVRGTVIEDGVSKCLKAGAKKIYWLLGTPPVGEIVDDIPRGCLFGVDMPPNDNFIIRKHGTPAGIASYSGAAEVYYISKNGMFDAYTKRGLDKGEFCTYCIGGPHPFNS